MRCWALNIEKAQLQGQKGSERKSAKEQKFSRDFYNNNFLLEESIIPSRQKETAKKKKSC